MSRPYFKHSIQELESLFSMEQGSLETLEALKDELRQRSSAKARQLLERVESLIQQGGGTDRSTNQGTSTFAVSDPCDVPANRHQNRSHFPPIPKQVEAGIARPVSSAGGENGRRSAILEYWRAVEIFNPQQVPRVDPRSFADPVYECSEGQIGPWEDGHLHRRRKPPSHCLWRFVVYGGIFPTKLISSKLEDAFGRDPETFDERVDGNSAVFSIALTHQGEPLLESFVLSSVAWALGRLNQPGPGREDWLQGFESVEKHIRAYLEECFVDDFEGEEAPNPPIGRPLEAIHLMQVCEMMVDHLGLSHEALSPSLIVSCQPVSFQKYKNTDDHDVLNSFFFRDLHRVAREVGSGQCGSALAAYLEEPGARAHKRVDVRKEDPFRFCWEKLNPAKFQHARWPSAGHHPLVYSQQIAVNELFGTLANDHGLFGINGPPGTGKTTLLRDVVAGVITQRAMALCSLKHPQDGFISHENWKSGTYTRRINLLAESLCGFDMVVASANNGAVENVTLELPGIDAIDRSWQSDDTHFSEFASRLLQAPAWGLIAARLGNKANRREFLSRFWYDSEGGPSPLSDGFLTYLKKRESAVPPVDWGAAVRRFQDALKKEVSIRDERTAAWKAVIELREFTELRDQQAGKVRALEDSLRIMQDVHDRALATRSECERVLENARKERLDHMAFRPSWWEVLLTFGKSYREWRVPDLVFQKRVESAQRALAAAQSEIQDAVANLDRTRSARDACLKTLTETEARLQKVLLATEQARTRLGAHFCYDRAWMENESVRELSSPWMDREWGDARAEVFFAALELHREFIHANAAKFRQNLTALSDVLAGNLPGTASARAVKGAWSAQFFVTPVISTTFASIDRLFSFHDQESIGWLFVDEAGQATPQAAAGALWRSRRAVIVGDPLQLEPILSLPFTAQDSLSRHFAVGGHWRPGSLSCQRLADEASTLGTWLPSDDEPLWVGSPLRVHRRCDELMFHVSNRVAYDGLMIFGTPSRAALACPPSRWLDVPGGESSDSHWIPEEGRVSRQLLAELIQAGISPGDIFLISPFRTVVRELKALARSYEGIRSGTIHTVQGKEADIVILVLGGNPARGGAKDWAASKPNLINVAASRAKRRLYVVGDRMDWQKRRYFSTLSAAFES